MKTLIAALTLATLIAAPVSIQSATAGTNDGYFGQWKQGCNITYMGFPAVIALFGQTGSHASHAVQASLINSAIAFLLAYAARG